MSGDDSWKLRARCADPEVDPEIFFPDPSDDPEPAKQVCAKCRVREECLAWALINNEGVGVWGGLDEKQRRRVGRRRARAGRSASPYVGRVS